MRRFYISLILVVLAMAGCSSLKAGYMHGLTERDVRGQILKAQSGPGKDRLDVEIKYDPTIRNFVGQQPSLPDYIYTQGQ